MKDCIICGGPTGSHEHIFPAALGGRRTNKGIYCGPHNEGFSPLAATLSRQLETINALLGVRPDHSSAPRQFEIVNPSDGQRYLVTASLIEHAEPKILKDEIVEGVRHMQMAFSNERQIQEWIAAERAAGNDVHIVGGREPGQGFFTQPYKVELKFGGPDGLRAVGYVALTFLAHYFPQVARAAELKPFKDFVLGATDQQPVWWDFTALPAGVPSNAFRFGHRIIIGLSASRQEAFARIFLFSTLAFSADFGSVPVESDETVIVDIDPLADHPPDDIRELREKKPLIELKRPSSLTESLRRTIESGEAQGRFSHLLKEIFDSQIERTVEELLPKIRATLSIAKYQRFPAVKDLLAGQRQRVLNLMLHFIAGLKRQFEGNPDTARLSPALDALVMGDINSGSGLSQTAACALELATAALADQICRDLEGGQLDTARLSLLLGGGPGEAVVGRAVLQPFMTALGIRDWAPPAVR